MTAFPKPSHLAAAAVLSLVASPVIASAQASAPAPSLQPVAFSSSSHGVNPFGGDDIDGRSPGSAPDGSMKTIAPQYGGGNGGGGYKPYNDNSSLSHFAFEAGGGFTAPLGNAASGGFTSIIGDGNKYGTETWGGNFIVGAGWSFTKRFTLLGELSYNDNKIPGRTLSAFYNLIGGSSLTDGSGNPIYSIGGNIHTYGITAEPVFYYYTSDKHSYSGYIIGGGGWYHKSVNFTEPAQYCDYYYGYCGVTNQTFSSYSDSGLGANLGTGISFKPFGQYSRAKLFAEARYVFVGTPRETATSNPSDLHTGTEELIPVTVGIRF